LLQRKLGLDKQGAHLPLVQLEQTTDGQTDLLQQTTVTEHNVTLKKVFARID